MRTSSTTRRGIVLAGGSGSRLLPLTRSVCKQLLPVYDKPMVYYPLSVLMLAGIRRSLVICDPGQLQLFQRLLGDGSRWGIELSFETQSEPRGVADALLVAEQWLDGDPSALVLGDNLFFGTGLPDRMHRADDRADGATVFTYPVSDPSAFAVMDVDGQGKPTGICEKPETPSSALAVTGLYFYDSQAPERARSLTPSARGELEITSLNQSYLDAGKLHVESLGRGDAWMDMGTHADLLHAAHFVEAMQERQGLRMACLEEIAWRQGWISSEMVQEQARGMEPSSYAEYLHRLIQA
ncbi:MAG: glucose-1-phosphate thymidylyltransferase RfbA [Phycisphaerales bacterium]|nr:glucose-1-phosphate thymidylyltransferase RfbA [Phycisphaerales bacterium]